MSARFFKDANLPWRRSRSTSPAAGIKRVTGDLVYDASAFDDRRIPEGWKTTYLGAAYAARVSALSLNENLVWVVVSPAGSVRAGHARAGRRPRSRYAARCASSADAAAASWRGAPATAASTSAARSAR